MNIKSDLEKQNRFVGLHGVIGRNFPYFLLPKWAHQSAKYAALISEEITKTEKKIGKQKTEELVIQFKNEAFSQTGVNSEYIINRLRNARNNIYNI